MSKSSTSESSMLDLLNQLGQVEKELKESDAKTKAAVQKTFELSMPGIMQLNGCYEEINRLRQVVIAEDTSDDDKIKNIRRAILKFRAENSKVHFPEGTLEDEFLKDETNKEAFYLMFNGLQLKLVECNEVFVKLGEVIADESLSNTVKLDKIENILVASKS